MDKQELLDAFEAATFAYGLAEDSFEAATDAFMLATQAYEVAVRYTPEGVKVDIPRSDDADDNDTPGK